MLWVTTGISDWLDQCSDNDWRDIFWRALIQCPPIFCQGALCACVVAWLQHSCSLQLFHKLHWKWFAFDSLVCTGAQCQQEVKSLGSRNSFLGMHISLHQCMVVYLPRNMSEFSKALYRRFVSQTFLLIFGQVLVKPNIYHSFRQL